MRVRLCGSVMVVGAAVAVSFSGAISGCAPAARGQPDLTAPPAPARINHVVLFRLKDPAHADLLIADSRESLGAIPGVVSLFAGKHVDAGRAGVMTDYDVCVYVGFDSLDDYGAYVADPRHRNLVARWKERFLDYRVYDVLDGSPREARRAAR